MLVSGIGTMGGRRRGGPLKAAGGRGSPTVAGGAFIAAPAVGPAAEGEPPPAALWGAAKNAVVVCAFARACTFTEPQGECGNQSE